MKDYRPTTDLDRPIDMEDIRATSEARLATQRAARPAPSRGMPKGYWVVIVGLLLALWGALETNGKTCERVSYGDGLACYETD